jgi:hypothetical protein
VLLRAISTSEGDTDVNAEDFEARLRARALSRWESEGGALAPAARADAIDETALMPELMHHLDVPSITLIRTNP